MDSQALISKGQIIKWIENLVRQKFQGKWEQGAEVEIEAKIGSFVARNTSSQKYLNGLLNQCYQLSKEDCQYEFQSRINLVEHDNAIQLLKKIQEAQSPPQVATTEEAPLPPENLMKFIQRIDFNFNKNDQRASLSRHNQQVTASLIQKKKQLTQHYDVVDKWYNYRISMNLEKNLSSSMKDILSQIQTRQAQIKFIRIKQSQQILQDSLYEYTLSEVFSITHNMPLFETFLKDVAAFKHFEISKYFDLAFKNLQDQHITPCYEIELEIKGKLAESDDQACNEVARNFYQHLEELNFNVKEPPKLVKKQSQDFDEPKKKAKVDN